MTVPGRTIACTGPVLSRRVAVAYAPAMDSRQDYGSADDCALMLRYADGEMAAFEALYRRHNDALYRYLLRLARHPAVAEDVFQEAWSKIIKARDNYRPTAKFATFLYRVAHNCFIDHLRRNGRHGQLADVEPDHQPDPAEPPELQVERALARRRLDAALLDLPDEQREVFLLHEEAGLNLDQIASITDANRETVKSRLRYAMNKLRAAIGEPEETS